MSRGFVATSTGGVTTYAGASARQHHWGVAGSALSRYRVTSLAAGIADYTGFQRSECLSRRTSETLAGDCLTGEAGRGTALTHSAHEDHWHIAGNALGRHFEAVQTVGNARLTGRVKHKFSRRCTCKTRNGSPRTSETVVTANLTSVVIHELVGRDTAQTLCGQVNTGSTRTSANLASVVEHKLLGRLTGNAVVG